MLKRANITMTATARNLLLWAILIAVAVGGCRDRSDSEPSQQTPELRKKIAIPEEPTPQTGEPSGQRPVRLQKTELAPKPAEEARTERAKELPQPKTATKPPLSGKKDGLAQPAKSDNQLLAKGFERRLTKVYDPTGKHDPFKSFLETETQRIVSHKKRVKRKRLPLTPLQRLSLGQLKVVGIIISAKGNKALVEDPSGKGYIISKGTYIGQDFGRVKKILKDRVVVEAEVEDFVSGATKLQTTDLKLQKKDENV